MLAPPTAPGLLGSPQTTTQGTPPPLIAPPHSHAPLSLFLGDPYVLEKT